jgi:AbrB family looped-hinge helix DNA binding protein
MKSAKPIRRPYASGRAKVSSKGWIVIPKEMRDELDIQPGDEVSLMLLPPLPNMKRDRRLSTIQMIKIPRTRDEMLDLTLGMFRREPGKPRMTQRLIEERRREVAEDERKSARHRRPTSA